MDSRSLELDAQIKKLSERLERVTGKNACSVNVAERGYTTAHRLIVGFSDGSSVFVKAASDELTAGWLRDEYRVYRAIDADFMAKLIAWDDDGVIPIMVLEDLSSAIWPDDWSGRNLQRVLKTVESVREYDAPDDLPKLESMRDELTSWKHVAKEPQTFLSLGLCSASWLELALPALIEAERDAVLDGTELVHLDIRSDNICFVGERVVLVDWNWARVGNSKLDLVFWLPSVAIEGGPPPQQLIEREPYLVALVAGYFAYRAGMPPPHPGSTVRDLQLKQLEIALPWAADVLKLPLPN